MAVAEAQDALNRAKIIHEEKKAAFAFITEIARQIRRQLERPLIRCLICIPSECREAISFVKG